MLCATGQFYLGEKTSNKLTCQLFLADLVRVKSIRGGLSKLLSLVLLSATAILSAMYKNKINKTLPEGCQLHAQKVKSRLGYIGRHQFLFTFTICHTSEENIVISTSFT